MVAVCRAGGPIMGDLRAVDLLRRQRTRRQVRGAAHGDPLRRPRLLRHCGDFPAGDVPAHTGAVAGPAEAGRGRFRRRAPVPADPLTGAATMSPSEAVERLNVLLAHAWMVRTFLKHAEEIQEDEELLDVPRTLFDSIRAVEPARERGDT